MFSFLFCDLSHGNPRCSAKMKIGAVCNMYRAGENPCYNGACSGGRCVLTVSKVRLKSRKISLFTDFSACTRNAQAWRVCGATINWCLWNI